MSIQAPCLRLLCRRYTTYVRTHTRYKFQEHKNKPKSKQAREKMYIKVKRSVSKRKGYKFFMRITIISIFTRNTLELVT